MVEPIVAAILDFCTFFSTQLLILSLLFCIHRERREPFWLRFTVLAILYLILCFLIKPNDILRLGWFSGGFLLCFMWVLALQCSCFRISLSQAFFFTASAYTGQHLLYWLKVLLEICFFPQGRDLTYFCISFGMMVVVCLLFYLVLIRRYEEESFTKRNNQALNLFSFFLLLIVNGISQISQGLGETRSISTCMYGFLCCVLLLMVQFRIFEQSRTQREKELVEGLLYEAEKQQRVFKESLDVINLKCHDLKHQIAALKQIDDPHERRVVIDEVEQAIVIYDTIAKTGNETLDVVITEKSLQAEKHQIHLAYIADGSLLDFLTTTDLASFIGNILDNAIESVRSAEPEKRVVFFRLERKGMYAWLHAENWCGTQVTFRDGFPVTSRGRDFHGFGVLSLRTIAEKYGAELRMAQRGETFCVDALFPLPPEKIA